jgi:hypothetical protein
MRKVMLTVALVALVVLPAVAQFRPGGFGGFGQQTGDTLLTNKSVQKELKFTEEQTKEVGEISAKQFEAFKEAGPLFKDDFEKAQEIIKKAGDVASASLKKFKEKLTSEQTKRFDQIQVQLMVKNKNLDVFKNESVVKALSLSDKIRAEVKEATETIAKDAKELYDDAGKDRRKQFEAGKKVTELRGEAYAKIEKMLSEEQTKTLKDLQGESFEYKSDFGKGGFGKDKGKKEKKDDF